MTAFKCSLQFKNYLAYALIVIGIIAFAVVGIEYGPQTEYRCLLGPGILLGFWIYGAVKIRLWTPGSNRQYRYYDNGK